MNTYLPVRLKKARTREKERTRPRAFTTVESSGAMLSRPIMECFMSYADHYKALANILSYRNWAGAPPSLRRLTNTFKRADRIPDGETAPVVRPARTMGKQLGEG